MASLAWIWSGCSTAGNGPGHSLDLPARSEWQAKSLEIILRKKSQTLHAVNIVFAKDTEIPRETEGVEPSFKASGPAICLQAGRNRNCNAKVCENEARKTLLFNGRIFWSTSEKCLYFCDDSVDKHLCRFVPITRENARDEQAKLANR